MAQIFSGVKVLDLTKVFSGPMATRMLADFGAEVLKIENSENYDDSRNYPPLKNGASGYFEILNRNKKSICLNLKDARDLEAFYEMCKTADVFVENLTPSTKLKLKVDYQTLKKINPKIIYASLSGVRQETDRKYYDVLAQAESGLMSLSGENDKPVKIGPSVVDAFSGMSLAFALASALYFREKTGLGQSVEVSMLGTAMNLLESNLIEASIVKKNPVSPGNFDNAIAPFGIYQTKDGYISLACGNDRLWRELEKFLKEDVEVSSELFMDNDLRLKNQDKLTAVLESVFGTFKVDDLVEKLSELNIPCSKVNKMLDVLNDEKNFENGSLVRIDHPELGKCVIPGLIAKFSEEQDLEFRFSPKIQERAQNES